MSELVWNDGMSVGIDAIDEDHKKIISILAKLSTTNCHDISDKFIEEIFAELETYVIIHFSREERLLEKVGYKDLNKHKASHQKFIEKLPQLKRKWLTGDNDICCEEITSFLNNWLVEHIFKEDFDYIGALQSNDSPEVQGLKNTESSTPHSPSSHLENNSLLAKFSYFFSQKTKLNKRLFLIAFIPVFGVLLLSLMVIQDNYQAYKNKTLLLSLNNIIMQVDNVSHSLQSERGLSSGVVSSNIENLKDALFKQRLVTDQAVTKLLTLMENEIDPSVQKNIQSYFEQVRLGLKELAVHRQHLDDQSESFTEVHRAYTLLIKQLLSISENLTDIDMNSPLANNISAINSMLIFKEYMGQIRAIGMNKLHDNSSDIYSHLEISLLVGKQLHALRVFKSSVNEQQIKACADFCNETEYVAMLKQTFFYMMNNYTVDEKSQYWFDFMSGKIDELKVFTGTLTLNFKNTVAAESQSLRLQYLAILFILSFFLLGMILFSSILNFSIINPIRHITHALNSMSKGDLTIYFNHVSIDDEIGSIQIACEELRRKLLQVGIFESVVDNQKKEIAHRKSQQKRFEVLAFTDALTGAVNRHQFDHVLNEEISCANRDQQDLSILMLDIDYFKKINDTYGHGVGDDVLIVFYNACKKAVRSNDVVARIGGEEFVIVLPKTNVQSAYQFAERLRKNIENLDITIDDNIVKLTTSIGVSQWQKDVFSSAEDFVSDADRLLYKAKNQGRNRVVCL